MMSIIIKINREAEAEAEIQAKLRHARLMETFGLYIILDIYYSTEDNGNSKVARTIYPE